MRFVPVRLGAKINTFVVVFLGVIALVTAGLLAFGFHRSQDSARARSREGLIEQARSQVLYQAETNAFVGNTIVDEATDSAAEAAALLVDLPRTGAVAPINEQLLATAEDGRRYDADPERTSDVFIPAGVEIDESIVRELRDSAVLGALFPALLDGMPDALAIFYTSVQGVTRHYPPSGFSQRAPATRPPRDVEALRRLSPQANPLRSAYWTPPYEGPAGEGLLLTSYTPVYEGDTFRGMIGVDLSLERLIERVDSIQIEGVPSSFAFVISSDGTVIPGQGPERVRASLDSPEADAGFVEAIEAMRAGESGARIVRFEGEDVFIGYAPLGAVGGSLAVVAPVDDVTAGADAVGAEISDEGRLTISITLATMLGFFLLALGATAWLTRRALIQPLQALVEGTRAVAAGELHTAIRVRSGDEIGVLAGSFNEMTAELARTRERVDEQQQTIRASEAELRTLFAAMTDAVFVMDRDGRYLRAAPTRHRSPMPDPSDYVGRRVFDRMPADRADRMLKVLQTAIDTGEVQFIEHESEGGNDRRWFSSVISPLGDGTAMVVGRDITERVQAERFLEQRVEERTREIASLLEVSRNVASTLEMPRLLELILDEVGTVAPFHRAAFLLREGNELVSVATRDIDEERGRRELGLRFTIDRRAKIWEAVSRGEPIIIADIRGDDEMARAYRGAVGAALEADYADITSWLAVPVALKDRVIGMLALSAPGPGAYEERQANLAGAIASQAAVALENARLFEETERRRRELASLLDVAASVASTLDLDRLVQLIADRLQEIIGFTGASILIAEGDELVIRHSRPIDTGAVGMRFPLSRAPEPLARLTRGEPVIVEDVLSNEAAARELRGLLGERLQWPAFRNVRSWMGIPMMLQDRPVGVISMSHSSPGFLTPEHARVTMGFANHAAIAFDNARLYEQSEERAAELATLLDISTNVASTLNLRAILGVVIDQLRTVTEYTRASLFILEGQELVVVDSRADTEDGGRSAVGLRVPIERVTHMWAGLTRLEPVFIDDVRGDSPLAVEYRGVAGAQLETAFRGVRGWMGVPIAIQDRVIGAITLSHPEPGFYTERHGRLALTVANQAAVAIENARLYEQAERQAREMAALLDVSRVIASKIELGPLVKAILEQLREVVDYAGASVLMFEGDSRLAVVDWRTPELQPGALRQAPPSFSLDQNGHLFRLMNAGEAMVIDDIRAADPYASEFRTTVGDEFMREAFPDVRSWVCAPLRLQDRTIGVITASSLLRAFFTPERVRLISLVANQAAVAIENARLYERAQQAASLEERARLARELHDSVSQALYGIALGARTARTQLDREPAKAAEPLDYVLSLSEAGLAEMRALIFELRPESLELEGLVAGLQKQAGALQARHGITVDVDLCGEPDVPLPVKEAVSRIAQEAMHNTVKHARATRVGLRLYCDGGSVTLDIEDNGRGFDPDQMFAGHLGLRSMRERVADFGGTIAIRSAPGAGARIRVSIPVTDASK